MQMLIVREDTYPVIWLLLVALAILLLVFLTSISLPFCLIIFTCLHFVGPKIDKFAKTDETRWMIG